MLKPVRTDRCRHGSVYHNNGLWQLEINRRLNFWRKNPSQYYDTVIVRRTKYQELWKGLYVNCCDFFYAEDFVGRIGFMLNFTPLRSRDTFYNHASRSQKGKILRWNKHAGQQADPVSVHCLQTNEKPRDKMRSHLGCSTTHGRAKFVPHWIPQFHQIFTSSASSTWRRAKAKLVNNKS